ncbi:MAG: GNAT family N-acetyltransferase [Pyrinomonadaceae bacterium]
MKIVPFEEADADTWDQTCEYSQEAWLFHRRAWVDIETRYFVRANHSFALIAHGEVIGVCPLYLSDAKTNTGGENLLHSGIHRQAGLAVRERLSKADIKAVRSAAMREILERAEQLDVDRVQLNAHNLAPRNLSPERDEIPFWAEDYGFQVGLAFTSYGMQPVPGMATCNADQIISLARPEDELFGQLEESCRRAVRKAQAFDFELLTGANESAIDEHYRIAKLSATRTGEGLAPYDFYRDVWRAFASERRCAVLFAKRGSATAAAVILLIDKGGASFLAGVSDPEYLPMRVNDFLHWSAIVWSKRAGLHFYRLGPWFPTVDPEWPIAKVSRFKKKFGGRAYTIIQGSYFRHPEKYLAAGQKLLGDLCCRHEANTCT